VIFQWMPICVPHATEGGPCDPRKANAYLATYWVNDDNYTNSYFQLQWHKCESVPLLAGPLRTQMREVRTARGDINVDSYRIIIKVGSPWAAVASSLSYSTIKEDWEWLKKNIVPTVKKSSSSEQGDSKTKLSGEEIDDLIYQSIMDQVMAQVSEKIKKKSGKYQTWKKQVETVMENESLTELRSLLESSKKQSAQEKGEDTVLDHQTMINILYQTIVERIKKLERWGVRKMTETKCSSGDESAELQKALEDVQKLEEKVICTLCKDREKDTSLKPCNHVFCSECVNLLRKDGQSCPLCREDIEAQEKVFL